MDDEEGALRGAGAASSVASSMPGSKLKRPQRKRAVVQDEDEESIESDSSSFGPDEEAYIPADDDDI